MSSVIDSLERSQVQDGRPPFDAGDRVRVHFQVIEGNRRRTQVFEGVVIKRQGSGARETFTVRKQSFGVGVERMFPLHSPKIEKLEVAARGDVRRAKLYYLRDRIGKAARVAERRWGIGEDVFSAEESEEEYGAVDSEGATLDEVEAEAAPVEAEEEEAAQEETSEEAPEAEAEQEQEAEEEEEPQVEDAGDESPDEESGDSQEDKA